MAAGAGPNSRRGRRWRRSRRPALSRMPGHTRTVNAVHTQRTPGRGHTNTTRRRQHSPQAALARCQNHRCAWRRAADPLGVPLPGHGLPHRGAAGPDWPWRASGRRPVAGLRPRRTASSKPSTSVRRPESWPRWTRWGLGAKLEASPPVSPARRHSRRGTPRGWPGPVRPAAPRPRDRPGHQRPHVRRRAGRRPPGSVDRTDRGLPGHARRRQHLRDRPAGRGSWRARAAARSAGQRVAAARARRAGPGRCGPPRLLRLGARWRRP